MAVRFLVTSQLIITDITMCMPLAFLLLTGKLIAGLRIVFMILICIIADKTIAILQCMTMRCYGFLAANKGSVGLITSISVLMVTAQELPAVYITIFLGMGMLRNLTVPGTMPSIRVMDMLRIICPRNFNLIFCFHSSV